MAKKKNRSKQQTKLQKLLGGKKGGKRDPGVGNLKGTAIETGKDVLIGVLGGGLIGAIIGKPAFLTGLAITGVGHYSGSKIIQLAGVGMMAANTFQKSTAVSGLAGLDGIKERVTAYRDSLKDKLYLDKIMKKKVAATTNGIGEVDYFNYPDPMNGHLAALDDIEDQIAESAQQFQGQIAGSYSLDMDELEERLY